MSETEAMKSRMNDYYGERPTWPMGQQRSQLHQCLDEFLLWTISDTPAGTQKNPADPLTLPCPLSKQQREALALLNLEWPITIKDLKHHYKALAKKHHPDLNLNDKQSTDYFKQVNHAYQILKEFFKELKSTKL